MLVELVWEQQTNDKKIYYLLHIGYVLCAKYSPDVLNELLFIEAK